MADRWTAEDLAWAHECAAAGDSFEEIGGSLGGVSADEVRRRLKVRRAMTEIEAEVASLLSAGVEYREIGDLMGKSKGYAWYIFTKLEALGYRMPRRRLPHAGVSTEIAAALAEGLPNKQIRSTLGVSVGQVAGVRHRLKSAEGAHG